MLEPNWNNTEEESKVIDIFLTEIHLRPKQKIYDSELGENRYVYHIGEEKRITTKDIIQFYSTDIEGALNFKDSEVGFYRIEYDGKDITDNLISFIISDFVNRQKQMDGELQKLTNDFIDKELSKNTKMTEQNKYYTPSEKELLEAIINNQNIFIRDYENNKISNEISFNFNSTIDNINSFMLMNNYHSEYGHYFNPELYAIKYLDKQDIEELGLSLNEWFSSKGKYGGTYKLEFYNKGFDKRISIYTKEYIRDGSGRYEESCLINKLPIKNKSELKRLLQKLDII